MRRSVHILALSLFLGLIQCSSDSGPSGQVSVTVSPDRPIVSNTDVLIPITSTTSTTITAPFIGINITVANGSSEILNVSGVRFEVSYTSTDSKSGTTSTIDAGPTDISPASFSSYGYSFIKSSTTCTTSDPTSNTYCDQNLFAQLSSGQSLTFSASNGTNVLPLLFYFMNLPKNDGRNFSYRIKMSILGYFGTSTNITSRLSKSIYFTTQ